MITPLRPPAHSGLWPLKIDWEQVEDPLADNIQNWTGIKGTVYQMPLNAKAPFGYYKIMVLEGISYFAKLIKASVLEPQLQSDKITRWLAGNGVNVNCILPNYPKPAEGDISVLLYHYLEGRYAAPNVSDVATLGAAIADLHLSLKHCPWSDEIKSRGLSMHSDLHKTLQQMKTGGHSYTGIPNEVMALLVEETDDLLDILITTPQVVHGDLNIGNVLYLNDSDSVIFLDFEDTGHSWFSPLMEVAFAIERFALLDDDEVSLELGSILYQSYREKTGISFHSRTQLFDMLRALSVRALLLLIHVTNYELWDVPDSEWQKFMSLYQQANRRKALLEQIICG